MSKEILDKDKEIYGSGYMAAQFYLHAFTISTEIMAIMRTKGYNELEDEDKKTIDKAMSICEGIVRANRLSNGLKALEKKFVLSG